MITITKKDLIALGYGNSFATDIIRQAKRLMVSRGFDYYESRKLDRVPVNAVEQILGISLSDTDCTPEIGVNINEKRYDDKESR